MVLDACATPFHTPHRPHCCAALPPVRAGVLACTSAKVDFLRCFRSSSLKRAPLGWAASPSPEAACEVEGEDATSASTACAVVSIGGEAAPAPNPAAGGGRGGGVNPANGFLRAAVWVQIRAPRFPSTSSFFFPQGGGTTDSYNKLMEGFSPFF